MLRVSAKGRPGQDIRDIRSVRACDGNDDQAIILRTKPDQIERFGTYRFPFLRPRASAVLSSEPKTATAMRATG
jgi:hypothetical protein